MSFFDAFKRALGFGPDPDLISDSDTVDDPDVVAESADASEPRKEAEDSSADTPAAPSVDPDIKARIRRCRGVCSTRHCLRSCATP